MNSFSVDVPALATLVVVVEEANAAQPPNTPYTVEVSGLVGSGMGPGPCTTGGDITLSAAVRRQRGGSAVVLNWAPADGGMINIVRDGAVIRTTRDDGSAQDHLDSGRRAVHVYQVCKPDTGTCSNEVKVKVPGSGG